MKVNLNRITLGQMPEEVRAVVARWKDRYRKRSIQVEQRSKILCKEDAKYTVINLVTSAQKSARAAGEYAGMTELSPTAEINIPEECVVIEEQIFLGHHYLTIFQPASNPITRLLLQP